MLRTIFGLKRDEVIGEWRKLHNEEISDLYSSPTIVLVIKSRRMRWAVHVERMGARRIFYGVYVGNPEGKRPLWRPRRRWRIILKWNCGKWDVEAWTGSSWLRIGTGCGHLGMW